MSALLIRPVFLLFGDSITQQSFKPGGWGATLANEYARTADIVLRGYSGYNTRWCKQILRRVFPSDAVTAPTLVTVMLGANDANLPPPLRKQPPSASRQHVPVDEYKANLLEIIDAARRCGGGGCRVLLLTPPPCDHVAWSAYCAESYGTPADAEPNRHLEATQRYAAACLEVGAESGTPTVDVHSAFTRRENWQQLLSDGLHPNEEGDKVIAEVVLDGISTHFPDLRPSSLTQPNPEGLQLDFPDHKEVDVNDLAGTFSRHCQQAARE